MISEQTIDKVIERIADEDIDWLKAMTDDQPVLAGYLSAEDLSAFTDDETQYLYYLTILCWSCFDETYEELGEVEEELLSIREENNWNRVESLRPASLKTVVDRILPDYPEPELLYYLEDALQLDEEDAEHPVTKAGQLPMFVTLLTVVDALTACKSSAGQ